MEGWTRNMTFEQTGLEWVPTSPHIPNKQSPYFYALTGIIGELDPNLIGVGYTLPFQTLVAEWINADTLAQEMNNLNLAGVKFRPIYFKPYYMPKANQELQGVQIHVTDFSKINLTEIQFRFMEVNHKLYPKHDLLALAADRYQMFDKVCGTNKIREAFMSNYKFEDIKALWSKDVEAFKQKSAKYYLYNCDYL